ncbi:MAG TPA: response regulator transcription factor [Terriglobales bacterium]
MASILIVDDHPAVRRALRLAFERQPGFTVCGEAEDGFDAIGQAKKLSPDLIVLDLRMPVMDGLEAARELKRLFPHVPLMMLTCYHSSAAEKEARASGVTAVFSKPDGMQNLIWQARAVLTAPQTANSKK